MTADDLSRYVGANAGDFAFVVRCWSEASAMVADYIGSETVPLLVAERATLEVGSELFHRRQAPNGIAQFTGLDGAAVRVARDPMVGAYPLLDRYVLPGLA